jgi:hypothetical protein
VIRGRRHTTVPIFFMQNFAVWISGPKTVGGVFLRDMSYSIPLRIIPEFAVKNGIPFCG